MTKEDIQEILEAALNTLLEKDFYLLVNSASERAITHRLAVHLTTILEDRNCGYHVDCEYNLHANGDKGRKHVHVMKEHLMGLGMLTDREKEETVLESEYIRRAVYPDIIVHRRGFDEHNLLVAEVKKLTSKVSRKYDEYKVEAYTSGQDENNLKYEFGVLIELYDGLPKESLSYKVTWS